MPPERTNSGGGSQPTPSSSTPAKATAASSYTPIYAQRQPIRRSQKACKFCRKSKGELRPDDSWNVGEELMSVFVAPSRRSGCPSAARCDGPEAWPCRRCRESGVLCEFENMDPAELQQALQSQQAAVDGGEESKEG